MYGDLALWLALFKVLYKDSHGLGIPTLLNWCCHLHFTDGEVKTGEGWRSSVQLESEVYALSPQALSILVEQPWGVISRSSITSRVMGLLIPPHTVVRRFQDTAYEIFSTSRGYIKCSRFYFHVISIILNSNFSYFILYFRNMIHSEKAMATHSSTLAWKIPWMEEPGGLQSMGSLGVRHDWVTSLSLFTFMHWRRKWQPTPVFLPGESQGRGSVVGCRLWGRTESDTTEAT